MNTNRPHHRRDARAPSHRCMRCCVMSSPSPPPPSSRHSLALAVGDAVVVTMIWMMRTMGSSRRSLLHTAWACMRCALGLYLSINLGTHALQL